MSSFDREIWTPRLLSVLRIGFAYILLFNGWERIRENPPLTFNGAMDAFNTSFFWLQMVLAALLLIGLLSRLSATVIFIEMAFNYVANSFIHGRYPPDIIDDRWLLFCLVSLFLASAGPGPWSLDAMQGKSRK